jgi:hypothetical protein
MKLPASRNVAREFFMIYFGRYHLGLTLKTCLCGGALSFPNSP